MSLLQMSLQGAVLILVILVLALFATSAGKQEEQMETMATDSGLELRVDLNGDGASTASVEQETESDDAENSLSAGSSITVAGLEVSIRHSETDSQRPGLRKSTLGYLSVRRSPRRNAVSVYRYGTSGLTVRC